MANWLAAAKAPPKGSLKQIRITQYRRALAARKRFLQSSVNQVQEEIKGIDEFDKFLEGLLGQSGNHKGSSYVTEGLGSETTQGPASKSGRSVASRSPVAGRSPMYEVFDELLSEGVPEEWVRDRDGLRIPRVGTMNDRLAARGYEHVSRAEIKRAYIAYLNGE